MQNIKKIIQLIDASIKPDAEMNIMGGEIIADNYDEKVDYYRGLVYNSKDWLTNYQSELSQKYSLSNLKIKYTGASGYFIELPKSQSKNVPEIFIHKQTLVNASRYITVELKQFEEEILEAEGNKSAREYEIFLEIRDQILNSFEEIKNIGDKTAYIDFISSMSYIAYYNNYTKPEINQNYDYQVLGGRHPVIEQTEKDFISNDLTLTDKKYVHIITGPNMGGKSTFLRQNALILLMAHIGSFVPARKAIIPLTDRVFSRIGANDNLFLGQSTFMVEMQEVANILNNSTKNSFVIIDEVGRGTSTYDGMSLAWAILRENHDKIKAKTLFATHYHELIDESKKLTGVENFSVAVGENEDNLVFLRKIIPGGIKKSFGLEVARIAGISSETIKEARKMLRMLELEHNKVSGTQLFLGNFEPEVKKVEKEVKKESKVEKELQKIDINNLTPIEALNVLSELKKVLIN
ncbi:MAG: DNA mismatch repair protein MutS [Candidatus Gracilibacteria bacterium]|nr:DNA mismatch repair protein MutS [Candidatus Gracilibacteria bacterium]